MSRTISATTTAAVNKDLTTPVYLVRMGFAAEVTAACWGVNITWNAETWIDSGIEVSGLSATGANLRMPTGTADPWLALVLNEGTRGKTISIYEHVTDTDSSPQTDATLLFTGVMDEAVIKEADRLKVAMVMTGVRHFKH